MSAVESASQAAAGARQLCHDLYGSLDVAEIYTVTSSVADAMRSIDQALRMLARHVDRLDHDEHYDDENYHSDVAASGRIIAAAEELRAGDPERAVNELSHLGRRS